jgi:hypothetical protein
VCQNLSVDFFGVFVFFGPGIIYNYNNCIFVRVPEYPLLTNNVLN